MRNNILIILAGMLVVAPAGLHAAETSADGPRTVAQAYPRLALGILTCAKATELPEGMVLRAGDLELDATSIDSAIAAQPAPVQEDLKKNAHLILDQMATQNILLRVAREVLAREGQDVGGKSPGEIIQNYMDVKVLSRVVVTDAEIGEFYEAEKSMFGGATLTEVSPSLKQHLLGRKKQEAMTQHIRDLGKSTPIEVSASWLGRQAVMARDNPVDKARDSGKPSLVDFGATGCGPCEMMTPILENMKSKYAGKLNVLFVHVRERPVLAAVYGIRMIPVQVFFDGRGNEVCRHIGFFPQDEIEERLAQIGVTD